MLLFHYTFQYTLINVAGRQGVPLLGEWKNHLPVNFIPILTAFCWQKIEKKKNMISPEIQNETAKVYFKESNITGDVI